MLTTNDELKLIDFGLSKRQKNIATSKRAGTP
jgi:hypothetical protein